MERRLEAEMWQESWEGKICIERAVTELFSRLTGNS